MDIFSSSSSQLSVEKSINKILIDIIKYLPSRLLISFSALFLIPMYTNILSPKELGLYNAAIAALSFIAIIFSDWTGITALRFYNENQGINSGKNFFSSLLVLLTMNLSIMYILCGFFFESIRQFFQIPSNMLIALLVLIIPVSLRAVFLQVLRAQIKPLVYTSVLIVNQILTILLTVLLVSGLKLGATGALISMSISMIAIDIFMVFNLKIKSLFDIKKVKVSIINSFYKYGIPLATSSLGIWLITQGNKIALQNMKSLYILGLFGVAQSIAFSVLLPVFSAISMATIPRIINKYNLGMDTKLIATKASGYYIMLFAPLVALVCFYPKEIILMVSNQKYISSYILLPFLTISAFLSGLTEFTTIQYHLSKKTYVDAGIKVIPGIIGVILTIFLVPVFNIWAVGISTLITYLLTFMLSITITNEHLCWEPPYGTISLTIKALAICGSISLMDRYLFVQADKVNLNTEITIFLCVYFLSILINKVMKQQ